MHAAKHLKMAFWNDATLFGLIYPDRLKTKFTAHVIGSMVRIYVVVDGIIHSKY